jgi:PAS domain S-box-containing protein
VTPHPRQALEFAGAPSGPGVQAEVRRSEAELERLLAERTQELRAASESLDAEIAERRRAEATGKRQERALRALSECNEAVVRAAAEEALFGAVCRIVVEVGGHLMSWVGIAEQDARKTVRPVARAGRDEGYLSAVDIVWADSELGQGPAGIAVRTGKPAVARDVLRDEKLAPWRAEIARRGYASVLSLPLAMEDAIFGVLSIYSGDAESFDDEEIALLARLADNLAFGVVALRGREERARLTAQLQADHRDLGRMMSLFAKGETRTSAVIENAIDGIVLLGAGGRIQGLNRAAEEILGWTRDEAVGHDFVSECVAPRSRQAVAASLARTTGGPGPAPSCPARREVYGRRRGGREFPLECSFTPLQMSAGSGFCAFLRDLTESRRLELELQQAQKLEAVGQLAAGIAHEINTPIQFIGDNTRFLGDALQELLALVRRYGDVMPPEKREEMRRLEEESELGYLREEIPRTIERTLRGVERVGTIVRAMKEFAHPDQREMVACDLNGSIQATLEIARNEYKYVADVEVELGELPLVTCHPGDLNQVFLNIIVNAAHAISDVVKGTQEKGKIRVRTRQEGEDVVIAISDTGGGIPEAIRDKVFDPFFTTKPVGRGTGQGLAIARSIVAKHRGTIRFETEPGKGTTFLVRVPLRGHDTEGVAA